MMSAKTALEYSILAQQCYYIKDVKPVLPNNWEALFYFTPSYGWGNLYAMFVNKSRKELVLGIRGTDNIFNMLSNAKLVFGAFTGMYTEPFGQQDAESLANNIHYNANFKFAKQSDFQLVKDISTSLLLYERDITPYILNDVFASLYASATSMGIFDVQQVVPWNAVSTIGDSALSSPKKSLTESLSTVRNNSIQLLKDIPPSINALTKSIDLAVETLFKGYELKIVGHSLGATMAELCAVVLAVSSIGFESPGSEELLLNIERYRVKLSKGLKMTNYFSAPNIINTLNGHLGKSYRIFLPHTDGSFSTLHAANCALQSVSRLATYATLGAFTYGKILIEKGVETALVQTSVKTAAGAAVSKLTGGAIGLWKDFDWLKRQHGLDYIVSYLKYSISVKIKLVISWPRILFRNRFTYEVIDIMRSTIIPLQKDLPGIRNLLDEEGMRETQITRISGYEVIT